jgi:hypothetical protein
LTLRQRRPPRVAEAGAHLPREQDYEPEKVSDQYTKTHLRFASLGVPKDDQYFLHPESPLSVDDQFKSDLKPGGVSLELDKPCPIRSKKSRRRIAETREGPRQQTSHARHEAPPPSPARSASARHVPTADDHICTCAELCSKMRLTNGRMLAASLSVGTMTVSCSAAVSCRLMKPNSQRPLTARDRVSSFEDAP